MFVQDDPGWSPLRGTVEPADRLPNPVSYLPGHDNGIVIDLPSPPAGGAREVIGSLTFGIHTLANDKGGTSGVLRLNAAGRLTTVLAGRTHPDSYIHSGTETYLLHDDSLPRCRGMAWAFCAEPRRTLDAEMVGVDGKRIRTRFSVGNYQTSRERRAGASDDVAEVEDTQSASFVWGRPSSSGDGSRWSWTAGASPGSSVRSMV